MFKAKTKTGLASARQYVGKYAANQTETSACATLNGRATNVPHSKMKQYLLILSVAFAATQFAEAQTASGVEWERAWGGSGADFAPVARATSDGGWILA